ncbi:hypothetical protein TIFTF001_035279, partial [Ficus carica]
MMKMFRTDISKQVSAGSSPPTLVSDCISRAIRTEYWINQDKEARAQIFKAKKEEKATERQLQPRQNQDAYAKGQTSNVVQHSKSLREELHLQQPEPEPPVSEQECEQIFGRPPPLFSPE